MRSFAIAKFPTGKGGAAAYILCYAKLPGIY